MIYRMMMMRVMRVVVEVMVEVMVMVVVCCGENVSHELT